MSSWLTDPELFLYVKGTGPDDVHLWRCKKPASSSSSLVVPMKPDDFDFVKIVENHLELIGYMDVWDEPDYNRLVKYLYEKRFLVNSQGFVIAELLHKVVDQQDGNKMIDDANQEEVPAIYIRSLDVLPLKPYIPKLSERPIPLRTVKYLGDVNGKAAAMMEEKDSINVTKLTARVEHLEAENIRLESKINNTLDTSLTKLTADLVTQMNALAADMVTQKNALATLQRELENSKEVWMNDLTNSQWVGFENFGVDRSVYDNIIVVKPPGSFTTDDATTNVQARYWSQIKLSRNGVFNYEFKAICLEDLNPRREKARFSRQPWQWAVKYKGKTYVVSSL